MPHEYETRLLKPPALNEFTAKERWWFRLVKSSAVRSPGKPILRKLVLSHCRNWAEGCRAKTLMFQHFTSPPKAHNEDTLVSNERAEDMPRIGELPRSKWPGPSGNARGWHSARASDSGGVLCSVRQTVGPHQGRINGGSAGKLRTSRPDRRMGKPLLGATQTRTSSSNEAQVRHQDLFGISR